MKTLLQQHITEPIQSLKKLNGYDNANYLLTTNSETFIFKTYYYDENLMDLVEAENEVLQALTSNNTNKFPKPFPFKDGSFIKELTIDDDKKIVRLLSFLEGTFLAETKQNFELIENLGKFIAELDIELSQLKNYVYQSRKWEWDIQYLHLNARYIDDISSPFDQNLVRYFFQQFEVEVRPKLASLRQQIIHNDLNEWNILVKENSISGVIDFGDVAFAPLINEVAVAVTYIIYDKAQPLEWAIPFIKAYHQTNPLRKEELDILYYLIAARLCVSVCNSAHAKKTNPDNSYALVSETKAWNTLKYLLTLNPIKAQQEFYKATGFEMEEAESIDSILKRRLAQTSSNLSVSYEHPIYFKKSAFQYMYDAYGNTFLDAYNNIPHVGHAHPKVVAAGSSQMQKLNTNTRYLYDSFSDYADALLLKFPKSLNKVFFVNSGSAASDLAIRLAQAHTNHQNIMVMEHGYHGNTQMSIDISDYKFNNAKGQGQKPYIIKTPIPDTYRGRNQNNDGSAGKQYADDAIETIHNSKTPIAAFISEPIVGCGGQVPLAKGYLKPVYETIRKQGGVCISDEVQTGFGRLGEVFWGFEAQEVVPDIVILGKPIANGHPMGAVVTTEAIANSFSKGVEFFSSFGGNPVSCEIAKAVLEEIEMSQLQQHALEVGNYYMDLFKELKTKHNCIGDVRGSGLFIGIDIVKPNVKEPDTKLAHHIKNELRNRFILVSTDGPFDNVIKSKPPLCFTKENAKQVVEAIEAILLEVT